MKVNIKLTDPNAKVPFQKHGDDFCYDLIATKRKHIGLFFWEYEVGMAMQVQRDIEPIVYNEETGALQNFDFSKSPLKLSVDIRPRSSIKDTGFVLCNSTGTIDEGYTGAIKFYFYHVLPWKRPYKVGDKIGQMKIGFTLPIEFVKVDDLNSTERGAGGFGSTGK